MKYAVVYEVAEAWPQSIRSRVETQAEAALRRAGVEGQVEHGLAGKVEGYEPKPGRDLFMAMGETREEWPAAAEALK